MMTIQNVGQVMPLIYMSAFDDPERFRRSKYIGHWPELTPARVQFGGRFAARFR